MLTNHNITVQEKYKVNQEIQIHKELAFNTIKAYSDHQLKTAKEDGYIVLSFDFAENILVPLLSPQPSKFYFASRKK